MCTGTGSDGGHDQHDHEPHGHGHHQRPDPGAFVRNLRQPMPVGRKIRLLIRNNMLKVVRLKDCCGHPGEPGC